MNTTKLGKNLAIVLSTMLGTCFIYAQSMPSDVDQTHSPVELSTLPWKAQHPIDFSKPVKVSGGIVAGNLLHLVVPVFPSAGKNCQRASGVVVMHVILNG